MPAKLALPEDLAFLEDVLANRRDTYCEAYWLDSDFTSAHWWIAFPGGSRFSINFDVAVAGGGSLLGPEHSDLLQYFKALLCVQTHPDASQGKIIQSAAASYRVSRALVFEDWLLLNAQRLNLTRGGIRSLTHDDLKTFFEDLASHSETAMSIYKWDKQLSAFLRARARGVTAECLEHARATYPGLDNVDVESSERLTDLSDDEIVLARAYLVGRGWIRSGSGDYKYSPTAVRIAAEVYKHTLRGGSSPKPVPLELCWSPTRRLEREYPASPTRTCDAGLIDRSLAAFKSVVAASDLLAAEHLPAPPLVSKLLEDQGFFKALEHRAVGRIANLPVELGLRLLRASIDFYLAYGEDIVSAYLAVLKSLNKGAEQKLSPSLDVTSLVSKRLARAGVRYWHLGNHLTATLRVGPQFFKRAVSDETRDEYFRRMRGNEGLYELVEVLYGAIQYAVGVLMARRQRELLDIPAASALDSTGTRLVFGNQKSGAFSYKQVLKRPVPPVAVQMIGTLLRLQRGMVRLGSIASTGPLFARPHAFAMRLTVNVSVFNSNLDAFCDYVESDLDQSGQRRYVRQHQLRRFFAMLFFWGNAFGGMETLRWFLGHTDIEHLWHYITESTPGVVLTAVKSAYAVERVLGHEADVEALADVLAQRFRTRNFKLLNTAELERYVALLCEEGTVRIEPEFFRTKRGTDYRVLVTVHNVEAT